MLHDHQPSRARHPYRAFHDVARRKALQQSIEVPALVRLLDLPRGGRILEVGCGRGVALPPLADLCERISLTGLDIDPGLLEAARQRVEARCDEGELCRGDIREMPFPDAAFDLVVDFGACYHVSHPEAALREIARVLVDGGELVHETPISQLLAHPRRSWGRSLPWAAVPTLAAHRTALLWSRRVKQAPAASLRPCHV